MEEDFVVLEALLAHDGSTNLAEAYTVTPALAMKAETINRLFDVESGTEQMALTEGTTNFAKRMNFTFFSSAHGTFSRTDHILGHKSSLGTLKKN